jgi:hypothetical protein
MKSITFLIIASLSAFAHVPEEKAVPIKGVYSPFGFDSNDRSEIVITGELPNLCHKFPTSTVKVEGDQINIEITSLYYEPTDPFCPDMVVPFSEVVSLGVLDKGDYKVVVNGNTEHQVESKLAVSESNSSAMDDYQYALVDYVERVGSTRTVKLKGYNPSDCYRLKEVSYVSNGVNTFSVLPKMERIMSSCPMKMTAFEYLFNVPLELSADKILLHVRKMDGRSVNVIFDQKTETLIHANK